MTMNVNASKRSGARAILRIVISLMIICLAVALAVSFSYALTKDKIEQMRLETERAAIASVFGAEDITYNTLDGIPGTVTSVFEVMDAAGEVSGYAVAVSPSGFGGNIDMIVGVDRNGEIVGVDITALSETPGLGSRVNDDGYLSQYRGLGGVLTLGEDVDAISGATISSRSVMSGVNRALAALRDMGCIAAVDDAA